MTKHIPITRISTALRELDPASKEPLTEHEQERANAMLSGVLAHSRHEHVRAASGHGRRRRRRNLALVSACLLAAAAAFVVPMTLSNGSAFASWSPTPAPLAAPTADSAAMTCRLALDIHDSHLRVSIGERRGGWTYVLLTGPRGEGACLMPDDLVGSQDVPRPKSGLFGSYDTDPTEPLTPPRHGIIETESTTGTVLLPGHASIGTVQGWFTWTNGYVGENVTDVTVHPPIGPEVKASLSGGRFTAWWPSGEARGDNPGVGGEWTYSVTLTDGTIRRVQG